MADEQVTGMNYFDHQFLRQADFETAQNYHVDRLRQHNRLLHQAGIIEGLNVTQTPANPRSVTVAVGRAIDQQYREVILRPTVAAEVPPLLRIQTTAGFQESEATVSAAGLAIDLSPIPVTGPVFITIQSGVKATTPSQDPGLTGQTRIVERAVVQAGTDPLTEAQLLLARVNRNAAGNITGIDLSARVQATAQLADDAVTSAKIAEADGTSAQNTAAGRGLKTGHLQDQAVTGPKIATGTIQWGNLHPDLQNKIESSGQVGVRGWVRLPFTPKRVGTLAEFTNQITHSSCGDSGAAGVVDIPVPAGATRIKQLRIAGTANTGQITTELWRAGINNADSPNLFTQAITNAPFNSIFPIPANLQELKPDIHGLALKIAATKAADIYLVAAEFE